jgi:DNA repair protein RecO (recombination protein O)
MTGYGMVSRAFCLHSRPYRDSSVIVQFFSEQSGRFSAVVKGVKGGSKKNGTVLPLLQPFMPVFVSLAGKSELKTLVDIEPNGHAFRLAGQSLFAGLYVNELLVRLLPEHIEYADIYHSYEIVLQNLQETEELERPLRQFEIRLLENLGYGVPFVEVDVMGRSMGLLQASEFYQFVQESGFVRRQSSSEKNQLMFSEHLFSGDCLLKIASNDFQEPEIALQAKQLMRMVMTHLLGNKPLNSKMLFS